MRLLANKARGSAMALIFIVILIALIFEYVNGFHDTAKSIVTIVATTILTPRQAVVMACTNLIGAVLSNFHPAFCFRSHSPAYSPRFCDPPIRVDAPPR